MPEIIGTADDISQTINEPGTAAPDGHVVAAVAEAPDASRGVHYVKQIRVWDTNETPHTPPDQPQHPRQGVTL
ncbi:MAG TPA: hypothetical protein VFZ97_16285 [Acidimicrobiales bacterium]